jgi:hypothetical protein
MGLGTYLRSLAERLDLYGPHAGNPAEQIQSALGEMSCVLGRMGLDSEPYNSGPGRGISINLGTVPSNDCDRPEVMERRINRNWLDAAFAINRVYDRIAGMGVGIRAERPVCMGVTKSLRVSMFPNRGKPKRWLAVHRAGTPHRFYG